MLREFSPADAYWLNEIISDMILDNVYLYIDSQTYGYSSQNVMTWILYDEVVPKCILYKYYNSLQMLQIDAMNDSLISEICDLISIENFDMVSGDNMLIDRIHKLNVKAYRMEIGYIFRLSQNDNEISNKTKWANYDQCGEIAALICSDQSIGGHYSVDTLRFQLEERMSEWGCRSRIITEETEIVSHIATYAELDNIAVLGGLVTRNDCRGKGYGYLVLTDFALSLMKEDKLPVFYCYKEPLWDWYTSLGWEKVKACAKLEKIM